MSLTWGTLYVVERKTMENSVLRGADVSGKLWGPRSYLQEQHGKNAGIYKKMIERPEKP